MEYSIRPATVADADIVTSHRRSMFFDMGHRDESMLDAMCTAFRPWVTRKMDAGEYLAWLVLAPTGEVVAGTGLWLMDWLPHMIGGALPRGNIVNVYTHPAHRRQGLARGLVETALVSARLHNLRAVILHASPEGRELYVKLGFQPTNEMRIML